MIIENFDLARGIKKLEKFASKDELRSYLMHVVYNAKRKEFAATDGKTLIMLGEDLFKLPEKGIHKTYVLDNMHVFIDDNNMDYTYPRYQDILPKNLDKPTTVLYLTNKNKNTEIPFFLKRLGLPIDLNFFSLLPKATPFEVYKIKDKQVFLTDGKYKILLMVLEEE